MTKGFFSSGSSFPHIDANAAQIVRDAGIEHEPERWEIDEIHAAISSGDPKITRMIRNAYSLGLLNGFTRGAAPLNPEMKEAGTLPQRTDSIENENRKE